MNITPSNSNISIISLDGNIGAGKSTILKLLRETYAKDKKVIFLDEPVNVWMNIKDDNDVSLLNHFYTDQAKYAFPFQVVAYISRLGMMRRCIKKIENIHAKTPVCIVTERCILSDKHIFAKMMKDTGKMSPIEFAVYNQMFDEFISEIPEINVVHINTSPEICLERCLERGRSGENSITLEYLTMCDTYNREFLKTFEEQNKNRILTIDCNTHVENIDSNEIIGKQVESIRNFITYHQTKVISTSRTTIPGIQYL